MTASSRPEAYAGSPLVNKALIKRRWKQRKLLRLIPDWVIETACRSPGDVNARSRHARKMPDGQDRALVKIYLRDVAEDMTAVLGDPLADMSKATADEAVQRLMYTWGHSSLEPFRQANDRVMRRLADSKWRTPPSTVRDVHVLQEVSRSDGEAIETLVVCLVWADELAGDYIDPRVSDGFRASPPE